MGEAGRVLVEEKGGQRVRENGCGCEKKWVYIGVGGVWSGCGVSGGLWMGFAL